MEACTQFLRQVRALTEKPVVVRVSHQSNIGRGQGQNPEQWIRDGLIDVVVPATHNHEPDSLDWPFDRFLQAASDSPRPSSVWPQIWPTPAVWSESDLRLHCPEAVAQRVEDIRAQGAQGVYFFNFCCFGSQSQYLPMFREIAKGPMAHRTDAG